jgi:hypothetical protein
VRAEVKAAVILHKVLEGIVGVTSNHFDSIFGVVSYTDHSVTRTRHFLIKNDQPIIAIIEIGVIFTGRNSNGLIVRRINRGLVFGEFYMALFSGSPISVVISTCRFFSAENTKTTANNL